MIVNNHIVSKEETLNAKKYLEKYKCFCPRCNGDISEIKTLWLQGCLDYQVNEVYYCVYCGQRIKLGETEDKL